MTLHEVIHGVAFAQAFNFYLQERRLIPPGALDDGFENKRIAFAQDLEAAQEYAHAQADLAWTFYQKVTPSPIYEWEADDETTTPYTDHGRATTGPQPRQQSRPSVPPPPPSPRRAQHLMRTVRVPVVTTTAMERTWKNDEDEPAPYHGGTLPY